MDTNTIENRTSLEAKFNTDLANAQDSLASAIDLAEKMDYELGTRLMLERLAWSLAEGRRFIKREQKL